MKKIVLICLSFMVVFFAACKNSEDEFVSKNPSISKITPSLALANQVVSISGKRFSAIAGENIVKFSGVRAEVVTANDTLLTVIVPAEGSTGNVSITVNNRNSKGPIFTYGAEEVSYDYITTTYTGSVSGNVLGSLADAQFASPEGVAMDPTTGDLIVADRGNQLIKRILKDGSEVQLIAGIKGNGYTDGNFSVAKFYNPYKIAVDNQGNIYTVDNGSHRIRKIDIAAGLVTTLAGPTAANTTTSGRLDGQGKAASFNVPIDLVCDDEGNVYVADAANHAIRKITPSGFVTTLAGNGTAGEVDGEWPNVRLNRPTGICMDNDGYLLVADRYGNRIRRIDRYSGKTTTIAGSGGMTSTSGGFVDGEALKSRFNNPWGIAVDREGIIYVTEEKNSAVRMIKNGQVSTIGGTGISGYVDGNATVSQFSIPTDVTVDDEGNIFIADVSNNVVRKITRVVKK